jgi:hypothetical protein
MVMTMANAYGKFSYKIENELKGSDFPLVITISTIHLCKDDNYKQI